MKFIPLFGYVYDHKNKLFKNKEIEIIRYLGDKQLPGKITAKTDEKGYFYVNLAKLKDYSKSDRIEIKTRRNKKCSE